MADNSWQPSYDPHVAPAVPQHSTPAGWDEAISTSCDVGGCESCDEGSCELCPPHWYHKYHYSRFWDEWHIHNVAKRAARRSMATLDQDERIKSSHFRAGFEQAFVDIATGGDGRQPAVPPEQYWYAAYRDCDRYHVDEWFAGYRLGAMFALPLYQPGCREIRTPQAPDSVHPSCRLNGGCPQPHSAQQHQWAG